MSLYGYTKAKQKKIIKSQSAIGVKKRLSFVFSLLGLVLIGNAVIPIVTYQWHYAATFGRILSPLIYENTSVLGSINASAQEEEKDYTLISSWFSNQSEAPSFSKPDLNFYEITIPKLGIKSAKIQVGGEDLKKTLIHYSNTAFPGQLGNAVIFGHSVLPVFFNPENYLTIFSTLYKLREGDEILISYDGINYRYLTEDLYEVSANDLSVLEQRYDDRFLTLITCSPPGTYLRRLVVKARLMESGTNK